MSAPSRFLPKRATLENYLSLIREHTASKNFVLNILNSLVIALGTTFFTVIVATAAGFSLSRYRNRISEVFAKLIIFIYVFPTVVIIVPLFKAFSSWRLTDSPLGLIIVETAFAIPFCIWLLRSFFDTIPLDLEESAMIDGANDRQAFLHITFPLSSAGISAAAIYTFITSWGEYVFSSIFLITDTRKTVPLGIVTYMGDMYIEWGKLVAGSVLLIIPVLILFYPLATIFHSRVHGWCFEGIIATKGGFRMYIPATKYSYVFSAENAPVARVAPPATLTFKTLDCSTDRVKSETDTGPDSIPITEVNPNHGTCLYRGRSPGRCSGRDDRSNPAGSSGPYQVDTGERNLPRSGQVTAWSGFAESKETRSNLRHR